jgi:hypothetical protein
MTYHITPDYDRLTRPHSITGWRTQSVACYIAPGNTVFLPHISNPINHLSTVPINILLQRTFYVNNHQPFSSKTRIHYPKPNLPYPPLLSCQHALPIRLVPPPSPQPPLPRWLPPPTLTNRRHRYVLPLPLLSRPLPIPPLLRPRQPPHHLPL